MSKNNVGGAAFPTYKDSLYLGMSLRDYFAVKAMAAFINCAKSGTPFGVSHPEINLGYAKASYAMADAMLKAREE